MEWIKRETEISVFQLPETNHTKAFCATCGSALPNLQMGGKLLVVPAGCLDTELKKRPNAHLFISSKAAWDEALEEVKKFERLPG
nr:GFA family protein [Draconibacterium orientale]